jgi:hypothetical protein
MCACFGSPADHESADAPSAIAAPAPIRVACGATTAYTDARGNTWSADHGFTGGNALVQPAATTFRGTANPRLYAGERWGTFHYDFPVPNGSYAVNLKFSESYVNGPGQRQFDVAINGKTVLADFDIFSAAGGKLLPVDEQFTVDVTTGAIRIDFTPGAVQSPKVDAIEVRPSAVALATTEAPYFGSPAQVPGRIAAANFDLGGSEIAYHDASRVNQGGAYRASEAIGIKQGGEGGGYVVGWNETGRWLKYTVDVSESRNYRLAARVASAASSGAFHVEADGRNVTGPIAVPLTGPWEPETWTTRTATVTLGAGVHVLELVVDAEWFDVDWISLTPTSTSASTPVAAPAPSGLPRSFFGQNWNRVGDLPSVPFGGLRLWDTETTWAQLEPSAGTYDWSELDAWLALAGRNGKDVLYTFGRTPQWASMRPTESCSHGAVGCAAPPSDVDAGDHLWKAFVTALVQHSLASPYAHIRYYEIWNEANLLQFWTGSYAQLVKMASDAYAIIHALDPNALVVGPSSSGGTSIALNGWYLNYFAAGGATPLDIVAYHAYLAKGDAPEGIAHIIDLLHDLMTKYGIARRPLWFTEGSWGNDSALTAEQAAGWLARQYLVMWSKGVGRYYWYSWDNPQWGTLWDATSGIHPAGTAYGQLEGWLVGSSHAAEPCAKESDATWTCTLALSNGAPAKILWNTSAAKTVAVGGSFTVYQTLDGATSHAITGGAVANGDEPVLVH